MVTMFFFLFFFFLFCFGNFVEEQNNTTENTDPFC